MKYFLQRDGRTYGPYSFDDLKRYQAENRIGPNDMIRRDDSQQWEPWQQVLNAGAAPAAPTFTPPAPAAPQGGGFGAPAATPPAGGAPQSGFGSAPQGGFGQPQGGFGGDSGAGFGQQQPPAFGGGGFGAPQGDQSAGGFGGGFGAPQGDQGFGGFGGGQAGFGGAPQPGFGGGTVGPMPPDMQWWLVLIIGMVCGLFQLFWIYKQVTFVKKIDPNCQAPRFYVMGFGLVIGGYVLSILGAVMAGVLGSDIAMILPMLGMLVLLGGFICIVLANFKMRESIHNYYTMVEPMGINLMDTTGAVLTFFFAVFYFQYHFANIAAQKKAMGHPAV